MSEHLEMFVITENPKDFPGKFVMRRWVCASPEPVADDKPVAVEDTLDACRAHKPPSANVWSPRCAADDPVIVETWF